jgi:hypothetical protein
MLKKVNLMVVQLLAILPNKWMRMQDYVKMTTSGLLLILM